MPPKPIEKFMKKIIVIAVFLIAVPFLTSAQKTAKFGHVDFAKLYGMMPGQDSIKTVYENYAKGISDQFAAMQAELDNKVQDYRANQGTMSDIIRQTKEREIQDLSKRIDDFQTQAQQNLQQKESDLTAPMIEKARKAVETIAKENGYTYVFNSAEGLLLYAEPSDDLLPVVKKKLGIQ